MNRQLNLDGGQVLEGADFDIHGGHDPREEMKYMAEKKAAPEHIKDGTLSVTIWTNKSKDGKDYNTFTPQRSYLDKEKKWQNTGSLRASDLLKMAELLKKAYDQFGARDGAKEGE
jgi:hypothetical protein